MIPALQTSADSFPFITNLRYSSPLYSPFICLDEAGLDREFLDAMNHIRKDVLHLPDSQHGCQLNAKDTTLNTLQVRWLGRMEYQAAWDLQKELAAQRRAGAIGDTLLLLEHPPTLTLGRASHAEHLLATPAQLQREQITVLDVDRGGDITYHGPGQLVGYPILNLRESPHTPDLHGYLRKLEEVLLRTLAQFRVEADRFPGYTGVWVGMTTPKPQKIAAIGVKSSRWITQHGFALNVSPNLSHFDLIVPCGIRDYGVTSLSEYLGRSISTEDVLPSVIAAFQEVFGYAPCR